MEPSMPRKCFLAWLRVKMNGTKSNCGVRLEEMKGPFTVLGGSN